VKQTKIMSMLLLALLAACGPRAEQTTTEHSEATTAHEAHSNVVSVTEAQMQMAGIELGSVARKNLSTALAVNGKLAVPNQNKAFVTSLGGGTVRSLRIHPGEFVRKGQVLATVANTEVAQLQQELVNVTAQISFTRKEVSRMKELVSGNAAPLKSLQKAEADLHSLQARQSGLRQQLRALGAPAGGDISSLIAIAAPISGSISDVYAEIGTQVDANTPIAQITNNAQLHLDLFVYEKDLRKVAVGQTIHFTLTNNPGKEYDARIYAIGTAFANQARAVPVHAHVINDKRGLIEGMSVTARISLDSGAYPAVPDDAIVAHQGKDYVFVLQQAAADSSARAGGSYSFERVQVFRGASDVGYTEIKPVTPLPEGTQIATKGAFFLIAMMTNEGEHEH
jgi:RND family efflux transporter MFP subunit